MSDTLVRRPAASVRPGRRDPAIDLVRNASLVVVVVLHALMFGVTITPDGLVFANAIEHDAWLPPVSWLVQVVPLFFLAGGFASLSSWRGMQARGESAGRYVARRLERLLVPAMVLGATWGVLLALAGTAGMPAEWIAQASLRASQPLWFLAVYVLATSLVPLMAAAHDRAPRLTLVALVGGAVMTDAVRFATGLDGLGAFNYAFVWLAVQQLGFHYREGSVRRWTRGTAGWVIAAAVGMLIVLTGPLGYPVDQLLAGNNPATVALVVLAVGQLALLRLLHPALVRLARRPRLATASTWFSGRAMTLYLWHMPALVALTGLMIVTGFWMPEPHTAAWWITRPVFLATLAVAVTPLLLLFARFEAGLPGPPLARIAAGRATAAALAACGAVVALLLGGFAPIGWPAFAVGAGLAALALVRVRTVELRHPRAVV